jgi:hypothetical protein
MKRYRAYAKLFGDQHSDWLPVRPKSGKNTTFQTVSAAIKALEKHAPGRGIVYCASIPYTPNMQDFPWGQEETTIAL